MVSIRETNSPVDLSNILVLQAKNTKLSLSKIEQEKQGYVSVRHTFDQLEKMNATAAQIIAVDGKTLVGYALVMPRTLKATIPILMPMFALLDTLNYRNIPVKELNYYVMGQICVAENYRRQGVFRKLYEAHRRRFSMTYDCCITEVSSGNLRSMQAHLAIGFELLHTFTDATDEWNIVIWNWTK